MYGDFCGLGGLKLPHKKELEKFISNNDKESITKLLKSGTVELQLFGIEGVCKLERKGIKFNESIYRIIDLIKNKNGCAIVCLGCTINNVKINDIVTGIQAKTR